MSQTILRTGAPRRPTFRLNGWPWLLPALLLMLWYLAAREGWMAEQILPAPSVVADTALSLLSGDLLAQWGFSLRHLALGLLWGRSRNAARGAVRPGSVRRPAHRAAVLRPGANSDAGLDPAVYGDLRHR
ncbi:Uncharacterised protein [Raoultella terrigena]|uniref:Uncharacterized protein n=1 Tax=Raoultella terrigena TaxID=577 RepID=A0A4U9D9J8_RAOTE|nr:Uncharacterised protein [Raoultella terrigena]